ncbi:MAG: hypothetical protein Kow0074_02930 [Candidatus Zixiibacteriota bacterium]
MSLTNWSRSAWIVIAVMLWSSQTLADEVPIDAADVPIRQALLDSTGREWCQTQIVYARRYPEKAMRLAACPLEGECDMTSVRDANIPTPQDPPLTIRLKFNIFRNDDGSSPAGTVADCQGQVDQLNSDFGPSRFNFVYSYEFIDDSRYRHFSDNEEFQMKNTYADQPEKQINVYVVNITSGYIGVGTFPWDPVALTSQGGIILDNNFFGSGEKTLTHELGHNLGLWHTHHGVSEVTECSSCWELADGSNGDVAGDFCSDTDPTPVNFTCSSPGGSDPCSGVSWGATDPQNYMGYAPDYCYTEFTPQQWGRMHCWTTSELTSQLALGFAGAPTLGEAPLNVTFTYESTIEAFSYKWYFGDGDSSDLASPSHVYQPGIYDVQLYVMTALGELSSFEENYVTAYADTLDAPDILVDPDVAGYWELWAVNAVPLTEIVLPINLSNVPSVIFFDSVSIVGTRCDYFESKQIVFDNKFAGQQAVRITADAGGGSPPLPPGSGPIARIHFRTRSFATPGQTSVLTLTPLGSWGFTATTLTGSYSPHYDGGVLEIAPPPCSCPNQGLLNDDAVIDALDMNTLIDHIFFFGDSLPIDPDCVHVNRGDVNCDGMVDSVDLNEMIDYIYFNGPMFCDPCACASYPEDCP